MEFVSVMKSWILSITS